MNVIWSDRAKISYFEVIEFILKKWTVREVRKFDDKTKKIISLIEKSPEMFPTSKKKNIRKCVLTKQTSLYYTITDEKVFLVTFWDNRRNPKTLKL